MKLKLIIYENFTDAEVYSNKVIIDPTHYIIGLDGANGENGTDGMSAYEIALLNGFVGPESEWLSSLKGQDGINGVDGINGDDGISAYQSYLNTTSDNPPLSEAEWSDSFKPETHDLAEFMNASEDPYINAETIATLPTATLPLTTETLLVFQNGVLKKITNGNLIGSIPDATTTTRGLVNIGTQTFGGNKTIIGESTTVGNAFEVKNSSNQSIFIVKNDGKIGVGTSPSYKFHVGGDIVASSIELAGSIVSYHGLFNGNIQRCLYGFSEQQPLGSIPLRLTSGDSTRSDGYITFHTAGLERLRISSNGNIGVGTGTPTAKLDVAGMISVDNGASGDVLKIDNGGYINFNNLVRFRAFSTYFQFQDASFNTVARISVGGSISYFNTTGGDVGIGTASPTAKLSVISDATTTGNAFDVKNSAGTELFKVLNNGGVSINGGNTGHKLSINGTLYADSLTVYSSLSSIAGNLYLANAKAIQFGSSTTISGIDGTSSYINFNLNSLLKFRFSNSGFEILDNIGIILPTPDGLHRYKLSIDNNGLPVTTLIL